MTNLTDVYPRVWCPFCKAITPLVLKRGANSAELTCEPRAHVIATVHEEEKAPPVMDRGD